MVGQACALIARGRPETPDQGEADSQQHDPAIVAAFRLAKPPRKTRRRILRSVAHRVIIHE